MPEPSPPLVAPDLAIDLRHYAGSVLSGHQPITANSVDLEDAWYLRCRISYRRHVPSKGLMRLASRTRLVVASQSGEPLLPVAGAATGAMVAAGEQARQYLADDSTKPTDTVELAQLLGVLPAGVTIACHAYSSDTVTTADSGPVHKRVVVLVSRENRPIPPTVALQIDDVVTEEFQDSQDSLGSQQQSPLPRKLLRRQIVLLEDTPIPAEAPLVLVFPSPFDGSPEHSFLVELHIDTTPPDTSLAATAAARCRQDLEQTTATVTAATRSVTDAAAAALTLSTTLGSLELARGHRPSLVFLAETLQAPLALDLALLGDAPLLATWARAIGAVDIPGTGTSADKDTDVGATTSAALAWRFERTALALLAKRLDNDQLAPELHALLAKHAGEAGRFPGSITSLLPKCRRRQDLTAALIAENLEFLDTSSPGSRVRAFDWLAEQGLAPANYDPLAERRARRAALAAHVKPPAATKAGK